ncbi:DUF3861 domain-containing protein [Motilimonas pumila]|uniref:DUF3861 family protein n=1 Tax=Motilimonas pumila TaxID=2303987 RepID=A0A418YJM4_9GAMM|nr:DUF3861 domain-containing protein [Motilimonas pumila]RJG51168.1 DUF3861 family protein [Motilimonas pumila]
MNSTIRKEKHYKITIEEVGIEKPKTLELSYQDREDLFKAVDNLKKGSGLTPETATQVAVALRLLGPVMIKDRKHPLFVAFMPHFKNFMQHLKSTVKQAVSGA